MSANRRTALRPGFDHLDGRILLSASPLSPAQIRQAYSENFYFNVNGRSYTATGAGQTIAIVIGGLDPNAYGDLSTFDRTFGIAAPPSFESAYFQGAQYNESADAILETSLDVEWVARRRPGSQHPPGPGRLDEHPGSHERRQLGSIPARCLGGFDELGRSGVAGGPRLRWDLHDPSRAHRRDLRGCVRGQRLFQ